MIEIWKYNEMRLRRFFNIFIGIACLILARLAVAETCEGDQYIVPNTEELPMVKSLAEAGDAYAQAQMGMAYLRGIGVELDADRGASLLEKSANGGDSQGQYLLGMYYGVYRKTDEDFKKAVNWFQQSANQGCLPALFYLGLGTKQGKGTPKDIEAGVRMITQAAEGGYYYAQLSLGALFLTGDGVSKDTKAGFNWIKRAADSGESAAEVALASLYMEGKVTERNSEAARSLLTSVYAKNDKQASTAAYSLGWMYMEGEGVPVDTIEAFRWMVVAASANVSDSVQRFKTLTEQLTKQKLVTACSVYMDPSFATSSAKEYAHVNAGETVALLREYRDSSEVYFPDRQLLGYIPRRCLFKCIKGVGDN